MITIISFRHHIKEINVPTFSPLNLESNVITKYHLQSCFTYFYTEQCRFGQQT